MVECPPETPDSNFYVGANIGALTVKIVALKGRSPYESDGYTVPPVFLRQVEVHVQQVLDAFDASPVRSVSLVDAEDEVGDKIPV
jgi:hypothetical protein